MGGCVGSWSHQAPDRRELVDPSGRRQYGHNLCPDISLSSLRSALWSLRVRRRTPRTRNQAGKTMSGYPCSLLPDSALPWGRWVRLQSGWVCRQVPSAAGAAGEHRHPASPLLWGCIQEPALGTHESRCPLGQHSRHFLP